MEIFRADFARFFTIMTQSGIKIHFFNDSETILDQSKQKRNNPSGQRPEGSGRLD